DFNLRNAGLITLQLSHEKSTETDEVGASLSQGSKQNETLQDEPCHGTNPMSASSDATDESNLSSHPGIDYAQIMCIPIHAFLVIVHLTLLGLGVIHKEHSIVFPIQHQHIVSFWCTVVAQAFGMIYYSLLTYITQKLAVIRIIGRHSILTIINDQISAWSGIGSAVFTIHKQFSLPVSFSEALSIFLYLLCISIINISTSALFSVETFNLPVSSMVQTQGIPLWNGSLHNSTVLYIEAGGGFLKWLGHLDESQTLGLSNGSLYDLLTSTYPGSGTAQVSATAFNITCGYISDLTVETDS
ncbi:hypothetical protein B0H14DRAFT_3745006, partial [Mycena olivaceomarginata]